jgi:hypothetical protein
VWDYLRESFADLDESVLLLDAGAKSLYDSANQSFNAGEYKRALEQRTRPVNTSSVAEVPE